MSNKRGNKKHTPLSQDFFALGANVPSTSQAKIPKRPEQFTPKKPGTSIPISEKPTTSHSQQIISKTPSWEENAKIVPIVELKDRILELESESNTEELIEQILCGAAKQLRDQKSKPDSCLIYSLIYLNKIRPLYFCTNVIVEAFSSILRSENLKNFKSKTNHVPIVIINLFQHAFHDENTWPEIFIKLYIEDSLGDRVWVDAEECKDFVEIIVSTFKTKLPPKTLLQTSNLTTKLSENFPNVQSSVESIGEPSSSSSSVSSFRNPHQPITSRYLEIEDQIRNYVFNIIAENLHRSQSINDITRNLLKLLIATAGIREVRVIVAQKIESWFVNPKLSRPAQDLLLTIFINCDVNDAETLNYLFKMRLKKQPFISHFILCFKELLNQNNGAFNIVMQILLSIETSATFRNTIYMQLLSIMFQKSLKKATTGLAKFFISMMNNKKENIRILRGLLREFARVMKPDLLNLDNFAICLLNESKAHINNEKDFSMRKKICNEIVDILTMSILLYVVQNYRDVFSRPDRPGNIRAIQMKIATIQKELINWIYDISFFKVEGQSNEYIVQLLKKSLFFESMNEYCKIDNWPPENDRAGIFCCAMENIPLFESVIRQILILGFNYEIPLLKENACDIIWNLVHRAATNFRFDLNYPVLLLNNIDIIDLLFKCSSYICQDTSRLPANYKVPNLAQIAVYWKVWITLTIIGAYVPSIFGKYCWDNFPTFQALIEMAITSDFQFPSKYTNLEEFQRLNQAEKMEILQFEQYLAQNIINESNSYLLQSLIELNPYLLTRRIPLEILKEYKIFCNNNLGFRSLICQSRNPDFLSLIIEKQEKQEEFKFMWLIDLVESYESNYGLLSDRCLSKYFLKQVGEEITCYDWRAPPINVKKELRKEKKRKFLRLISHFQNRIQSNDLAIVKYFIFNQAEQCMVFKKCSYKSLELLLLLDVESSLKTLEETGVVKLFPDKERIDWFTEKIMKLLQNNKELAIEISYVLSDAILINFEPSAICEFVEFICLNINLNEIPNEFFPFKFAHFLDKRRRLMNNLFPYKNIMKRLNRCFNQLFVQYISIVPKSIDNQSAFKPFEGVRVFIDLFDGQIKKFVSIHELILHGILNVFIHFDADSDENCKKLHQLFTVKPYPNVYKDVEKKMKMKLIPNHLVNPLLRGRKVNMLFVLENSTPEALNDTANDRFLYSDIRETVRKFLIKLQENSNDVSDFTIDDKDESEISNKEVALLSKQRLFQCANSLDQLFRKNCADVETRKNKIENNSTKLVISPDYIDSNLFLENVLKEIFNARKPNEASFSPQIFKALQTILDNQNLLEDGFFNPILTVLFTAQATGLLKGQFINESNKFKKKLEKFLEKTDNIYLKNMLEILVKKNYSPKKLNNPNIDENEKQVALLPYIEQKEKQNRNLTQWDNIYLDLAISNYYQKEILSENYNKSLLKLIWSRNRPLFPLRILHQSNCSTIINSLEFVLDLNNPHKLNSTAVLNFLNICHYLPNQFIGYQTDHKHDILCLTESQIKKLISYVVDEKKMEKRINLILRTCFSNETRSEFTINYLSNWNDESTGDFIRELYVRLYLETPTFHLNVKLPDNLVSIIRNSPSVYDKVLFNIITSFIPTEETLRSYPINAESVKQINYYDYSLLKLAANHPYVFLRHLTTISAMLQGTANVINHEVFRQLNSVNIFNRLMNIFNVLKPHIWKEDGLKDILKLFLTMFLSYSAVHPYDREYRRGNIEVVPLLYELIKFVRDWYLHNSEAASSWIRDNENVIKELSLYYPNVMVPFTSGALPIAFINEMDEIMVHLENFLRVIEKSRQPNRLIRNTLLEMDRFLIINVSKLPNDENLEKRIIFILQNLCSEELFCGTSLSIMLKILHKNPNLAELVLPTYLQCLNSSSTVINNFALDILPEFILLVQEHRNSILLPVFNMMFNHNPYAKEKLFEAYEAIHSQHGY